MPPDATEIIVFIALVLGFALAFAPAQSPRRSLLVRGGAGLAGTVAIAAVPTFDLAILVLLTLGVLHAAAGGKLAFAIRLRAPLLAVAMLALAVVLARVEGPDVLARFAAVGWVVGLAAGIGLLPYVPPSDPADAAGSAPVAWPAFIAPVLAASA